MRTNSGFTGVCAENYYFEAGILKYVNIMNHYFRLISFQIYLVHHEY